MLGEKKLHRTVAIVLVSVGIVVACCLLYFNKQSRIYNACISGTIIGHFRNSIVVQTSPIGYDGQAFYVFRLDEDSVILDRSGAEVGTENLAVGREVQVWREVRYSDLDTRSDLPCSEVIVGNSR